MSGFDVRELLRFSPPRGRCPRCLALITDETWPNSYGTRFDCPVCDLGFLPGVPSISSSFPGYGNMLSPGFSSSYMAPPPPYLSLALPEPLVEHAQRLGRIVTQLDDLDGEHSPIRLLTHLLLSARAFVHVMSTGVSQDMLGTLRTVAEIVPVFGIFGRIDKNEAAELDAMSKDGVPLRSFVVGERSSAEDFPHTKLIVIDGLVAISGSANLTAGAWRKATKKMERIEPITNSADVVRANNEYFASHWGQLNAGFNATGNGYWRYDTGTPAIEAPVDEA